MKSNPVSKQKNTENIYTVYIESPLGTIEIKSTDSVIVSVKVADESGSNSAVIPAPAKECIKQLKEYFAGERIDFSLPLQQLGTPFQMEVWKQLMNIPYGETISYKELAEICRHPNAMRAAGSANGKNQHWIIVPCHRVIAANGGLGGYAGGLWRKEWLLKHEEKIAEKLK